MRVLDEQFNIKVTFESDWHIGSGLGRPGDVDRLVLRDEDELPFLPGKTLWGILRDSAETVATGLDDGQPGAWYEFVRWLFGDQPTRTNVEHEQFDDQPRPSVLEIRPAQLPTSLRNVCGKRVKNGRRLRDSLIAVKSGVKINRDTGNALARHLRFDEVVRGGVSLVADCRWSDGNVEETTKQAASALLCAATLFTERMGGKRRRGSGRVKLELQGGPSIDESIAWLESHDAPEVPAPVAETDVMRIRPREQDASADTAWRGAELRVKCETPVLIPAKTVGNVVECLDHVPGTYFLPLFGKLLADKQIKLFDAIQNDQIRVAPATPEVNDKRGLPVPFCIHYEKGSKGFEQTGTNSSVSNAFYEYPSKLNHYKNYRFGFVGLSDRQNELPHYGRAPLVLRTHNTVDEERQKPTTEVGGVFSFQAIAAGTKLRTEIWLRQSLLDQLGGESWLEEAFQERRYSVGRSKKDDYGLVQLSFAGTRQPAPLTGSQELTIWFTSDLLLPGRSMNSAVTLHDLRVSIAKVLQIDPGDLIVERNDEGEQLPLATHFLRSRRTESWQVKWSRPRPSLICIQAGSCLRLPVPEGTELDPNRVAALEIEGLGLRRAEGYGMLRVNVPLVSQGISNWTAPSQAAAGADKPMLAPENAVPEELRLAQTMEETAWRRLIQQKAKEVGLEAEKRKTILGFAANKPGSNQAATLRSLVKRLKTKDDVPWLLESLGHVAQLRAEHWPLEALKLSSRRDSPEPKGRIVDLLTDEDVVWKHLQVERDGWPEATVGGRQRLKRELWPLAVRALVEAAVGGHQRQLEQELESIS